MSSANGKKVKFPKKNSVTITSENPAVKIKVTSDPTFRRACCAILPRSSRVNSEGSKSGFLFMSQNSSINSPVNNPRLLCKFSQSIGFRKAARFAHHKFSDLIEGDRVHLSHPFPRRAPTPSRDCRARHQFSLSRYHCTVFSSPSSTVTEGRQPSSSRMRVGSIA